MASCFLVLGFWFVVYALPVPAHAEAQPLRPSPFGLRDRDGDGIPDEWENKIFFTDPHNSDTDGDGFDDWTEIANGFHPHGSGKLMSQDADRDGLEDRLELLFGTDPTRPDTDGDGFLDNREVIAGFSPTSTSRVPLTKSIHIILSKQHLQQKLGGITLATFSVSTGRRGMQTPIGSFSVLSKTSRAWSRSAGLWMPWWMQFTRRGHGIHELPEWPGGAKEGVSHLGKPVSHGCVRLGMGPAKALYDWAPLDTAVLITR